jgi:hypothetical protein
MVSHSIEGREARHQVSNELSRSLKPIEQRSLLNAANHRVFEAFSDIHSELPFQLKDAHYDNGMEFINEPLLA